MAVAVGRGRMGFCIVKVERERDRYIHIQLNADAVIMLMFVEFDAAVWLGRAVVVVRVLKVIVMIMHMLMQMVMRNGFAKRMQFIRHGCSLNGAKRQRVMHHQYESQHHFAEHNPISAGSMAQTLAPPSTMGQTLSGGQLQFTQALWR